MLDHPTLTPLLFGFFVLINHQITDFFQIKFNNRYFGFNFHGFFLGHFAFEFVDYLYHQEEDKGDQQEVQYGLQKITVSEVGLADLE